jgi:hypothetical protein
LLLAGALLVIVMVAALAYGFTRDLDPATKAAARSEAKQVEQLNDLCASSATYARLKEVAFEEAIGIRNADPVNLDTLRANTIIRMEDPVLKSRDEDLDVTVCSGRFILELPPGAERAFGGERRLSADIEYAVQKAADGSGLVYQLRGAEPIIYKLAAFDLRRQGAPGATPVVVDEEAQPIEVAQAEPEQAAPTSTPGAPVEVPRLEPPARVPRAASTPAPRPIAVAEPSRRANPSFDCRRGRSRSERMVCSSDALAALDRRMSSRFYSALAQADPEARRALRRTRDSFLAYRERCRSEACVADAYEGRMREIRDIVADER